MRDAAPNWWSVVTNTYAQARLTVMTRSLSLAVPPWVGVMSTGDGYGHR